IPPPLAALAAVIALLIAAVSLVLPLPAAPKSLTLNICGAADAGDCVLSTATPPVAATRPATASRRSTTRAGPAARWAGPSDCQCALIGDHLARQLVETVLLPPGPPHVRSERSDESRRHDQATRSGEADLPASWLTSSDVFSDHGWGWSGRGAERGGDVAGGGEHVGGPAVERAGHLEAEHGQAHPADDPAGLVMDRGADAADAGLVLLLVQRVALLADAGEVGEQGLRVGERVRGAPLQAGAADPGQHLVLRHRGQD